VQVTAGATQLPAHMLEVAHHAGAAADRVASPVQADRRDSSRSARRWSPVEPVAPVVPVGPVAEASATAAKVAASAPTTSSARARAASCNALRPRNASSLRGAVASGAITQPLCRRRLRPAFGAALRHLRLAAPCRAGAGERCQLAFDEAQPGARGLEAECAHGRPRTGRRRRQGLQDADGLGQQRALSAQQRRGLRAARCANSSFSSSAERSSRTCSTGLGEPALDGAASGRRQAQERARRAARCPARRRRARPVRPRSAARRFDRRPRAESTRRVRSRPAAPAPERAPSHGCLPRTAARAPPRRRAMSCCGAAIPRRYRAGAGNAR
jgi:hypothetical protein